MSIGKTVAVLCEFDYDDVDNTIIGVFSSVESAKINAQIHVNNRTGAAGASRIYLKWEKLEPLDFYWATVTGTEMEYRIETRVLDAAIAVEETH